MTAEGRRVDDGRIETFTADGIGWLILANEARRNALSYSMYEQIPAAIDGLMGDNVRAIVVRGAGTVAFGAGSDISEFPTKRMGGDAPAFNAVERAANHALASTPVPVLAMIRGACRGGGLALALSCDLRIAADDATFAVPPARLGVGYPADGVAALVTAVGDTQARSLLLTAETIDASRAQTIGLVTEIVGADDLDARIHDLTQSIGALAPLSLRAAKLALGQLRGRVDAAEVADAIRACFLSADYREGVQAFLEKRSPQFEGD